MTYLLFLPAGDAGFRWMRIAGDRIAGDGDGVPARDADDRVVAVAPAGAVTLHWADLPARSPAQAVAAARMLAAEASAAPLAELHVAVGDEGEAERPIAIVNASAMQAWIGELAAAGVDPDAIVPAPMLLPKPDTGYVRAVVGGEGVVRGTSSGFADEPGFTELLTGDVLPADLEDEALAGALAAAAAAPVIDLRQGAFARRRRRSIDWPLVRRLGWLAVAIIGVTLAINLVRVTKYSVGADRIEAQADSLAATGLPRGETVTDAGRQLGERLSRIRGPGLGFTATTAAIYEAIRATPGTELIALDFQANGEARIGVSCEREALATDLKRAIEAAGFTVRAGVFQSAAGRITGEMTVVAP